MDNLVRTDTVFGKRVNLVGNISADLVLESLGKVYIKSRNKALTLEELITSLVREDPNTSTSRVKVVEGIENLDTSEFKDGTFVFDKLSNILYLYLDNDLLELINVAPEGEGYVKRSGDTMTGRLAIYVKNGPPLYVNSADLVENLNALYLNGETADKFTRRHRDEKISGSWTFLKVTTFDLGVRIYKDAVLHGSIGSPNFSSGFGGYGWRMDADTNTLTVDNLVVRKLMLVYELVVNKISATNGSLWISNAGKVTDVCKLLIKPYNFFTDTEEYLLFCAGLKEDFIKLTAEITNESLEAEAFSTSSGDNIITKECWSSNTLRSTKFIFIRQKGEDYRGLYFDDPEATDYSIFPLFSEDFKFNTVFPIITRNNYLTFKSNERTANLLNYISFILPYYKYFANGDYYLVTFDGDSLPVFKAGDILRCQKWTYGGIKYYDAIVCNLIGSKYIIQLAPSFLDLKTTISYNNGLEPTTIQNVDSNNENLYKSTSKYENGNNPIGQVEIDDSLVLIGNIWDSQRLNAVYITSTDDAAPYMDVLSNMNRPDYSVIYYVPIYRTTKLYKSLYNLRTFAGYNNLVEIPYTGDYYVLDISINNFTCEYVCFKHNDVIYLATGKATPNIAGVQVLHYLNTIPDRCTILGELNSSYITLETTGKIKLENIDGSIILEELLDPLVITSTKNTKSRFGKLDGIQDEIFPTDKQPYGYGLYGLNVFLTGEFYLNNGLAVADIGKEAMTFAIASSKMGNAAINLLRADQIRANDLIKASHYNKGTLKTAGMYIGNDSNGNPGIVIWGNKILFATNDLEFNGYVQPTMLLSDGKIQGKYLSVDEAHGSVDALVLTSEFTVDNVKYTSLDLSPGTVRVYKPKMLNTASNGTIYYTESDLILYIRRFMLNNDSSLIRWLVVNPDGYPLSKNAGGNYDTVTYLNFTYFNSDNEPVSYSDGNLPTNIENALINDYSTPLKVWALEKGGKGNLGGSTLYWNSTGKVVVNGILYSTEGNIGGFTLSNNSLYLKRNPEHPSDLILSNSGYKWDNSEASFPYMLLNSVNSEGKIEFSTIYTSRGFYYQGEGGLLMQTPGMVFQLTIIPIMYDNGNTWGLFARLSGKGVFSIIKMTFDDGLFIINFPLLQESNNSEQADWFVRSYLRGDLFFYATGHNFATTLTPWNNGLNAYIFNPDKIDLHHSELLWSNDFDDKSKVMHNHASVDLFGFISNNYNFNSYGIGINGPLPTRCHFGAVIGQRLDNKTLIQSETSGGLVLIGKSEAMFSNDTWYNAIVVSTADDDEVNFGGFTLCCMYSPGFSDRESAIIEDAAYTSEDILEYTDRLTLLQQIIDTYGTSGVRYTEVVSERDDLRASMTTAELVTYASDLTNIDNYVSNIASIASEVSNNLNKFTVSELTSKKSACDEYYSLIITILDSIQNRSDTDPDAPDAACTCSLGGDYPTLSRAYSASGSSTSIEVAGFSPSDCSITLTHVKKSSGDDWIDISSNDYNPLYDLTASNGIISAKIRTNSSTSTIERRYYFNCKTSGGEYDYFTFCQLAGESESGEEQPTDSDLEALLPTFNTLFDSLIQSGTSLYDFLADSLSTANSMKSSYNISTITNGPIKFLGSGYDDTAFQGFFMGMLLTALFPFEGSGSIDYSKASNRNSGALAAAHKTYGARLTDSVSSYESKYKGEILASIVFAQMIANPSFRSTFKNIKNSVSLSGFVNWFSFCDSDEFLLSAIAPDGHEIFDTPVSNNYTTATISSVTNLGERDEVMYRDGKASRKDDGSYDSSDGGIANKDTSNVDNHDKNHDRIGYFIDIYGTATSNTVSISTPSNITHSSLLSDSSSCWEDPSSSHPGLSGLSYSYTTYAKYCLLDLAWKPGRDTVNNTKSTSGSWFRQRPFSAHSDDSPMSYANGDSDVGNTDTTSYPSGHSGYSWGTALAYSTLKSNFSTSNINNLFARAYKFGQSRVIVGAHWLSDVETGRLAAACSFALMCGNKLFINQVDLAQ